MLCPDNDAIHTTEQLLLLFNNVAIESLAYELPEERVTSSQIEAQIAPTMQRLRIPQGIIKGFTGIEERRFWRNGSKYSQVATEAACKAIEQAQIDARQIGCLISTSVSRDYVEPSMAALVHGTLRLPATCRNYDISNACLGFLDGMTQIGLMIETGLIQYGLVVAGEGARHHVSSTIAQLQSPQATMQMFRDYFATLTLGSGAVAMLLCHTSVAQTSHRLNGAVMQAATEYNHLCIGQEDRMTTDASALMMAGSKLAAKTNELAQESLSCWRDEQIAVYAPHQVSTRNTKVMAEALGIAYDKLYLNFPFLGNIGAAAVPITLAMAVEEGRLLRGQQAGLLGIGSGLNCTMMSVSW